MSSIKISRSILVLLLVVSSTYVAAQTQFTVKIENISHESTLATPLAPGVFAVHDKSFALFVEGEQDPGNGMEALAEDGNPAALEVYVKTAGGVKEAGAFVVPIVGGGPGVLHPGEGAYEFTFTADKENRYLSFATMFVQSNDLFFAPDEQGIRLFRFGGAISGDITRYMKLWDAYTEVNEKPSEGAYQALRQPSENSGPSETGGVAIVDDQFSYPPVRRLIRVTITPLN